MVGDETNVAEGYAQRQNGRCAVTVTAHFNPFPESDTTVKRAEYGIDEFWVLGLE